jgi:hypothetical protein
MLGCASWSSIPNEESELPSPRLSTDAIVLETVLVRVPEDWDLSGDFWRSVDEQHLPTDVRRRLQDNGFRSGLCGTQIPDLLRGYLDAAPASLDLSSGQLHPEQLELFQGQHRLQMPAGKTKRVKVTTTASGERVVLFRDGDRVRAERFNKAMGLIDLRSRPLGDGRVQLEVVPGIEFGDVRQQWAGGQGSFVIDISRPQRLFDELGFTVILSPGQTLLLCATPEPKGLGADLFTLPDSNERSVLLLRLAQTQMDDLFSAAPAREPVTSTPD